MLWCTLGYMEATPHKTFCEVLNEEMKRRKLTDGALANQLGVSRQAVIRHRNGAMPSLALGKAYVQALRIPADRLLKYAEVQGDE